MFRLLILLETIIKIGILTEDESRKITVSADGNYNFILEGDNLQSLYLLEKTHFGRIDLIYIDPPYNTGEEDFIYDDNYVDSNDAFRHSKWLSFMAERLSIANRLLAAHGFIFISIDDKEAATLRLLCDEIFGESNYVKTDYIQVRYPEKTLKSDMKFHKEIEQVLVYRKSAEAQPYIKPEEYDYGKFIYSVEELSEGQETYIGGKRVFLFKDGEYKIVKHKEGFKNGLKEVWVTGTILNGNSSGRFFRDYLEGRKEQDGLGVMYKVYDIGDDQYEYRYFTGPKRGNATKGKLDDDLLLLDLADKKRKEIQAEYDLRGLRIRPLVLIQFPNGYDEWIKRVKQALEDLGYSENSGLVASWFSGDHPDNPEEIKKLDGKYAFLLFKQAIATGWDCPRAKILVKLREGGTERFNIQTIGRVRRMPERVHYECSLIDNCYVYTLDSEFAEGLTNGIGESFYTYLYKRKFEAPNIVLKKESLNGSDRYAVNPEAVVKVVREQMLNECDLNHDGKLDRHEMETSKGYVFGTKLKTYAVEGVARTTHDMMSLNKIFGGEHQISNHDDGFIIRDAKRRIARAIGIDENISNNALRVLFGPLDLQMSLFSEEEIEFERSHKLIDGLSLREYNAFLVNNRERLVDVFSGISADRIAEIEETDISVSDWTIPREQYYKQHKRMASTRTMSKNPFVGYGNNILLQPNRTFTEISFEDWCEQYDSVEWCYKNGDKGDAYFSIVYRMAFRRSNFYPDYIVQMKNGDMWIVEAKGGMTADGSSNNIDKYAPRKFEALKEYASRYRDIKWGFVRAVGTQIYLSNTVWSEDVTNQNIWKPIEDFI